MVVIAERRLDCGGSPAKTIRDQTVRVRVELGDNVCMDQDVVAKGANKEPA